MRPKNWVKILFLCLICLKLGVLGTTDPGDYAVLDEFRKGLSNAELLEWPTNSKDPCSKPRWPHISCSGSRVTQIQVQGMGLSGPLPKDFNKLSMLSSIGLQRNNFNGKLPSFNGLFNLQFAYLGYNQFDTIPSDFFVGLDSLQVLSLNRNPLNQSAGWMLPPDLANSVQLVNLSLVECNLVGKLPEFLGNMNSLSVLKLSYNSLTGGIPSSYSSLPLQILWLNDQQAPGLTGPIDAIANMTLLSDVWLHGNQFSGTIPSSIGKLTSLTRLFLNDNQLVGRIPESLMALPHLQSLQLDNNVLMGSIPDTNIANFTFASNSFCQSTPGVPCSPEVAALLDFLNEVNYPPKLSASWVGNDPCSGTWLGISCSGKVTIINLPRYHLNGTISPSLGKLSNLITAILGENNLSGTIPESMTSLKSLRKLDLSFNNISPPVPKFSSSVQLLLGGNKLLQNPSPGVNPPGGNQSPSMSGNSFKDPNDLIVIIAIIVGVLVIFIFIILVYFRSKRKNSVSAAPISTTMEPGDSCGPVNLIKLAAKGNIKRSFKSSRTSTSNSIDSGKLAIAVQVLQNATKDFAPENVLGQGGFGVVYKGELHDGTMIAVKRMENAVLSNQGLDEFHSEIAVLSKVRHRNLVAILGYSIEETERLLVYEYMHLGALSKHLFQWKKAELEPLSWKTRLNIALDVARGLEYLHSLAQQSFIHRDLKSSNILLGENYRAKISDFGLVKLAPDGQVSVATKLAGTFGYLAPEYAVTGKITTKIDVFSYGVVLMELLTGMMALDEERPEESQYLVSWFFQMKNSKEKLQSIIDPSIDVTDETFESVCTVAELACHCTAREAHHRPEMGHAVNVLAPLVEIWRPVINDSEKSEEKNGIEIETPLLQLVEGWQDAPGSTTDISLVCLDDTKGSIPTRPAAFAESFTSADGR